MSVLKPFKGIRPVKEKAHLVASRPYDVLNTEEAKKESAGNEDSFLHVIKPEIDFPADQDPYAPEIYLKGKENFDNMVNNGTLISDDTPCLYVYQLIMDGRKQTGILGCNSIDDYFNNAIKKHELTRPDKEEDRKNHVRIGKMNAEPVFFSYPAVSEVDVLIEKETKNAPEYDFTSEDGIQHTLWVISNQETVEELVKLFDQKVPSIYVADGHHRTAAGALVGKEFRDQAGNSNGNEEYNYFMSVLFPDNQLNIIDYNRVVKDLNGLSSADFLDQLGNNFEVELKGKSAHKPESLHNFGMFIEGNWYSLTAKAGTYNDNDPIDVLDVTVLSKHILEPILNIVDLRTDKRIDFVGGIRGLGELERRVDNGEMAVAFALYPVSMKQLIDISDSGKIMPPKTTWFEPKLRSGLVIHSLN